MPSQNRKASWLHFQKGSTAAYFWEMNKKISAIVIAKNAQELIQDCLESLSWANEIILVDNGSTDRTDEIAAKYGAKIVRVGKGDFSYWRNIGAKNAQGNWLFYVDTDERVTPELQKEILKIITSLEYNAYAVPRKNIVFGRQMKHCGFSPDYVKRLFRRNTFKKWTGKLHEEPNYLADGEIVIGGKGKIGHLKNELIHLKHSGLSEMVEKTNEWSEIEAKLMFDAHHPPMNIFRFFTAGFREFWLRFVRQLAFLDGTEGVIYGIYQVYSRLVSYAKLWEMQKTKK